MVKEFIVWVNGGNDSQFLTSKDAIIEGWNKAEETGKEVLITYNETDENGKTLFEKKLVLFRGCNLSKFKEVAL